MKKLLVLIACTSFAFAQDVKPEHKPEGRPPRKLSPEQKKQRDELVKKYDLNKDGKLDKEERKAISEEDRKKLGPPGRPPKRDKQ